MSHVIDGGFVAQSRRSPVQTYARVAGVLMVLTLVCGFLGEWYIPGRFLSSDPAATAQNITSSMSLYRLGFALYLVEACCDIGLAVLFYVLLKPVSKPVALAAAFFGLVSTALYAVAECFYFAPTVLLSGAAYMKTFTPEQINAFVMLSLRMFSRIGMLFLGLYAIATFLRGYLIVRSGYLPKSVGVLLIVGAIGFALKNVTTILLPAYSTDLFLAPMSIGAIALTLWLVVKGVDLERWEQQTRGV